MSDPVESAITAEHNRQERAWKEAMTNPAEQPSEAMEDAGAAAYREGYLNGFTDCKYPEGFDGDERDIWRQIDSTCVTDGWANYRDTFMRASTPAPVQFAAVTAEASEQSLSSEQPLSAGADHAPGSAARNCSEAPAPVQDDDAEWLRALIGDLAQQLAEASNTAIRFKPEVIERLERIAASLSTDTALVEALRGTMECPYCGRGTPHHHKPEEIAGMTPGLVPRLMKLADELRVGFYSAMHRAYGTDYSYKAEDALKRDLQQIITKLSLLASRGGDNGK